MLKQAHRGRVFLHYPVFSLQANESACLYLAFLAIRIKFEGLKKRRGYFVTIYSFFLKVLKKDSAVLQKDGENKDFHSEAAFIKMG